MALSDTHPFDLLHNDVAGRQHVLLDDGRRHTLLHRHDNRDEAGVLPATGAGAKVWTVSVEAGVLAAAGAGAKGWTVSVGHFRCDRR